jgi:hypothetical protein
MLASCSIEIVHGARVIVIATWNSVITISIKAEIGSAVISITAILWCANAGCAVVGINGAGIAIITGYQIR